MEPNSTTTPDAVPTPARKLPAWAMAILKYLITALLGGGMTGGAYYAANRTVEPTPPEITLAEEFYGNTGELIDLECETAGTRVRWRAVDSGLNIIQDLPDLMSRKQAKAIACSPGRYKFEVWSAISNEPTQIYRRTVVVGKPGPGPGPGPIPPTPIPPDPGPIPPTPAPPTPTSELARKLQACFTADLTTPPIAKQTQRTNIIGLYQAMADYAKSEKITTLGLLLKDLKEQGESMLIPSALIECRKIIAAEVKFSIGSDEGAVLDIPLRAKAVDVFGRIAKAMGEVK